METKPTEEWRPPTPVTSDGETSSSDESTEYEEEVLTPVAKKKGRTEEEEDPDYTPTAEQSTRASQTPAREQLDDVDRVSKSLT